MVRPFVLSSNFLLLLLAVSCEAFLPLTWRSGSHAQTVLEATAFDDDAPNSRRGMLNSFAVGALAALPLAANALDMDAFANSQVRNGFVHASLDCLACRYCEMKLLNFLLSSTRLTLTRRTVTPRKIQNAFQSFPQMKPCASMVKVEQRVVKHVNEWKQEAVNFLVQSHKERVLGERTQCKNKCYSLR